MSDKFFKVSDDENHETYFIKTDHVEWIKDLQNFGDVEIRLKDGTTVKGDLWETVFSKEDVCNHIKGDNT